jgi:hypothetical protein
LNNGTELYYNSTDALGSYPVTNLSGGSIIAYSASTNYVVGDAVSNGGTNWYCIIPNGPGSALKTPNDTNSLYWGKLKTATDDVGPKTPLTFAAVKAFIPGALRQLRGRYARTPGGSGERYSLLIGGEVDTVDENATLYVDENGVPYAIGA